MEEMKDFSVVIDIKKSLVVRATTEEEAKIKAKNFNEGREREDVYLIMFDTHYAVKEQKLDFKEHYETNHKEWKRK